MRQYTDVPLTGHVEGVDLQQASELHLTFRQGTVEIDLTGNDLTVLGAHDLIAFLRQEQTAMLSADSAVSVQINAIVGGIRKASDVATVPVGSNLLRRLIG